MLSTPLLPEQIDEGPVIFGEGGELTETVLLEVPIQPLASVTVTVYVLAGKTVID